MGLASVYILMLCVGLYNMLRNVDIIAVGRPAILKIKISVPTILALLHGILLRSDKCVLHFLEL